MFLNISNVVFLGRERINKGIHNVERSLALLPLSIASLVFGFGTFYRIWSGVDASEGLLAAVHSLRTMEAPKSLESWPYARVVASFQTFCNIHIIVFFVAVLVGQFKLEESRH